jgi:hypothetical protein
MRGDAAHFASPRFSAGVKARASSAPWAAVRVLPAAKGSTAHQYRFVSPRTSGDNNWSATFLRARGNTLTVKENKMSKILSTAIVAGLLFGITGPAFAADPPKTKAECKKLTDMKWDSATKACVKK